MQSSFDFGAAELPAVAVMQAAGTWLAPQWRLADAPAVLAAARARIEFGIVGATRVVFELALAAAEAELARLCELRGDRTDLERAFHVSFRAPDSEIERFIGLCDGSSYGDIHTRRRSTIHRSVWAKFIEGAGTVTASQWPDGHYELVYRPWKSADMQDSYEDWAAYYEVSGLVWENACQAMNMAENGAGPVSVSTVVVEGREWVNIGQGCARGFDYCDAWNFIPVGDWRGITHTYRERVQAWNDGSIERADMRGVKVMVRGQLAILMDKAVFIEKNRRISAATINFC